VNTISPFKTSVCGIDELAGHCESCVSHVLSILDPDWPLGRRGELVAAAAEVDRTQLDRRHYLAEPMRSSGRGQEIETAMS
jgi:hypothetical protein